MSESNDSAGPLQRIVRRLRDHAAAHEYVANADNEQKQWMNDLYDAADELERMAASLAAIHCHAHNLLPRSWALAIRTECEHALPELASLTPNVKVKRPDGRQETT